MSRRSFRTECFRARYDGIENSPGEQPRFVFSESAIYIGECLRHRSRSALATAPGIAAANSILSTFPFRCRRLRRWSNLAVFGNSDLQKRADLLHTQR